MAIMRLLQLGRVPYAEGLRAMERVAEARRRGTVSDTLLLMEHDPVLTLGRRTKREHILEKTEILASKGVELYEVNRGGDVTYHGPGQLVGYPVFDLRGSLPGKHGPYLGPVDFVRLIEQSLIRTCKDFGVLAQQLPKRTGVWTFAGGLTAERKIAAIGIHVAQGITSHGFALNVTTDLRDFEWIVPCGIEDRGVTSLEVEADPESEPTMSRVANSIARSFGHVFEKQVVASVSLSEIFTAA